MDSGIHTIVAKICYKMTLVEFGYANAKKHFPTKYANMASVWHHFSG